MEIVDLPDGGQVALDWYYPPEDGNCVKKDRVIVMLHHTLSGSSTEMSNYVLSLIK